ncbi:MAG TPA: hypothetical protein VEC06_06540 [Paucimonas sp.]|nr:hypothetical protein [Paucimonas sp.]
MFQPKMRNVNEQSVCERHGVSPQMPAVGSKLGIALSTLGSLPIHGLRHKEENGTHGWYIWCGGEMSKDDDFFSPLHIEHIDQFLPAIFGYLALPPGYRFLVDGKGYEDVWFDPALLNA